MKMRCGIGLSGRRYRIAWALVALALAAAPAGAATSPAASGGMPGREGEITGGLGLSWIDGTAYYNVTLQPEFSLGEVGVGLNLDLLVSTRNGDVRGEDLKLTKILRYVRYGHRRDPFYGRVGALDAATIGHGLIVYGYQNQAVENQRKLGLELGTWQKAWELEILTNNLDRLDLVGGRAAVAPLRGRVSVPLVSRIRVGTTWVHEEDENEAKAGDPGISAVGLDLELPLVEGSGVSSRLYFDWARLVDHGSGRALGIGVDAPHFLGLVQMSATLERRWSGAGFLPRYFDYAYEVERYNPQTGATKRDMLDGLAKRNEVLGDLLLGLPLGISVHGTYEVPDVRPRLGRLHLESVFPAVRNVDLAAYYDRKGVENAGDLFQLDERSLLTARVGYPLNRWLRLGVLYEWTYRWESSEDRYRAIRKVTPGLYVHAGI